MNINVPLLGLVPSNTNRRVLSTSRVPAKGMASNVTTVTVTILGSARLMTSTVPTVLLPPSYSRAVVDVATSVNNNP